MTIPLPAKIIVAVLAVLIILLFVVKKKNRKFVWLLIIAVAGACAWYGYKLYNKKNPDLVNVSADVKISVPALIKEYEINDSVANKKYLDEIIETDGNVKSIEKDEKGYYTLVLGDEGTTSSVRCSMDTTHSSDAASLTPGSSVIVRGACTGFKNNGDLLGVNLGADVELNRCVIVSKK